MYRAAYLAAALDAASMRALALASLAAVLLAGCSASSAFRTDAAPVADADRAREFVAEVPGVAQGEGFDRLRRWVARTYLSPERAIVNEDRAGGVLAWRAYTTAVPHGIIGPVPYLVTVEVDVRDGRLRWRETFAPDPVRQAHVSVRALRELRAEADAVRASALAAVDAGDAF